MATQSNPVASMKTTPPLPDWSAKDACAQWPDQREHRAPVIRFGKSDYSAVLQRTGGGAARVQTRCRLTRRKSVLCVRVEAQDPCMLDLVASLSEPGADRNLYEEDVIQVVLCPGMNASSQTMLLVNPRGSRTGSGRDWPVRTHRHAKGWTIEVDVPLPRTACAGLSVHRFYRGTSGEVQGLGPNLPHPLIASRFPCLVLKPEANVKAQAARWREQVAAAEANEEAGIVEGARKRLNHPQAQAWPDDFLEQAIRLAEKRFELEIPAFSERFLCWNEAHFQHAVLNLWDITGDKSWLERLQPRMQAVWNLTSEQTGMSDSLRGRPVPTWINDTETAAACTLVSGAILWPITRWMRIVLQHPGLKALVPTATSWIAPACRVLDYHDVEWIDFPDGSGMHLEPHLKGPRRCYEKGGSRINPLNREFFLSLPMLHLAVLTGNAEYRRKVTANARYFLKTSEIGPRTFVWEYQVGACPSEGEDLSHGACQVAFAEQCRADGILLTEAHLRKMANTLAENIFRCGDVPAERLRGFYPGLRVAVGAWSRLCRYRPDVLPRIRQVLKAAMGEGDLLFDGSQGWGIRLLSEVVRAEQQMQGHEPFTA
jgi:hypothetical protein